MTNWFPSTFPPAPPQSPKHSELKLGLPQFPPATAPAPSTQDLESLIRDCFAAGNRMVVITRDERGLFQTSMKRQDGISFAVHVERDVIGSIRGALRLLRL